jgi:hypothetical protein
MGERPRKTVAHGVGRLQLIRLVGQKDAGFTMGNLAP